jgi:hypothetical protein
VKDVKSKNTTNSMREESDSSFEDLNDMGEISGLRESEKNFSPK